MTSISLFATTGTRAQAREMAGIKSRPIVSIKANNRLKGQRVIILPESRLVKNKNAVIIQQLSHEGKRHAPVFQVETDSQKMIVSIFDIKFVGNEPGQRY